MTDETLQTVIRVERALQETGNRLLCEQIAACIAAMSGDAKGIGRAYNALTVGSDKFAAWISSGGTASDALMMLAADTLARYQSWLETQ